MRRTAPLFLVSAGALGFEIALTRFFAVALWNEYGYWVISIAMAGFAFSGVALALAAPGRDATAGRVLAWLPVALTLAGGIGFHFVITNRFNPLALQNPVTWTAELGHIAAYYAALLPFFFLAGLFVGLCFLTAPGALGGVYAADLAGAGAGAAALVGAMFLLPPFRLVAALLPVLAAAAGRGARLAALSALAAAEALLWFGAQPHISQYKPIFAPAHTQGARVIARLQRPSGTYALLDDFTERVDVDLSDDAAMLHLPGPPRALGLYRDGVRIAALPFPGQAPSAAYAPATLGALAYRLAPAPRVLLVGGGGGFRVAAARALGARSVSVLEPEPVLRAALRRAMPGLAVSARSPLALARGARWDLIDLAADQLTAAPATEAAFAAESLAADLRHLTPRGVLSVPVSIRDFPVYALRVLATVRRALRLAGIAHPGAHVIMARSAWTVRVLVSPRAFGPRAVAAARRFCDRRSFDLSWYPGIDVRAARAGIYNDLPPISFAAGTVRRGGPRDAIADEAGAVLSRQPSASAGAFSLAPMTLDRPFFFAALRLADLPTLLRRLEVLPQPEIAALVNLAVLAQAALIALAVLALPLAAPGIGGRGGFPAMALFFPALGLGFLFLELWLIAKATLWLDDAATGFAAVLSLMLIASGLGAALSARVRHPTRAVALAGVAVLAWAVAALVGLWPLILASLSWPEPARLGLLALVVAPLGLALGVPFPLGLARIGSGAPRRLAWAWGLNGAFSVLATPAAQLLARVAGWDAVLSAAMVLYVAAVLSFPLLRSAPAWSRLPRPDAA
jgi:hypothetical protein